VLDLSRRILEASNPKSKGLVTFFVYGKFAHGKTSYLLHVMYEVLGEIYKMKDVDSWICALDHLFFNPLEGLMYIEVEKQKTGLRVPVLGMDDVGQHIPRARWWREDVVQFREWMTVARSDVASIGFTAPTQLSLPGGIIDVCFLRVKIEKNKHRSHWSVAKGYEISYSPKFQEICSGPKFVDDFPTRYPDFVFEQYTAMRKASVSPLRRQLISLMGEKGAMKHLRQLGATQEGTGRVIGKSQQTISKRERQH